MTDKDELSAPDTGLHRALNTSQLILLGIGSIIGAGVYVMTGTAAAEYAGPAVVVSFALGGLVCAFTALCYAELAGMMPVAGSAFSYTHVAFGRVAAWGMGWLLLLEYGISVAGVAVGWSASLDSLLRDLGLALPSVVVSPLLTAIGGTGFRFGGGANLLAAVGVLLVAAWLLRGVRSMARLNLIAVTLKIGVLIVFLAVGVWFIRPENWVPFVPEPEGGSRYGLFGVLRGASALFFAYIGFEAVSTAAAETRDPQRQVPIGILGSLAICTAIYIAVSAVLTGIVPFRELDTAAPIALAASRIGMGWFALLIKIGSVAGLTSVMLILLYGQTRVFLAMSREGLIPSVFGRIHAGTGVPVLGTILLGLILAAIAATLPITLVGDLVSLGTATAFAAVCACVIRLRVTHPEHARPFRTPLGVTAPVLGILAAAAMGVPVVIDIVGKASAGDSLPAFILIGYAATGAAVYVFYGRRRLAYAAVSATG